jgi:hypothetical protein
MKRKTWFWILAVLITFSAAIYQRMTGPTYEKEVRFEIEDKKYVTNLPRSTNGTDSCAIKLEIPASVKGVLFYKRYPTNEDWQSKVFRESKDGQVAYLPGQPPAGKLQYYIGLRSGKKIIYIARNDPLIIRFKGEVPNGILIPHVLVMFLAMLFSTVAGLYALGKLSNYRIYGYITLILLIIGGFILGPTMQYYAFGDPWTGIPFGWDLTDNKTLIAFIGWVTAVVSNRRKYRPRHYIVAAALLLVVYSIPHSLLGSEYDYEKGEVTTGLVSLLMVLLPYYFTEQVLAKKQEFDR